MDTDGNYRPWQRVRPGSIGSWAKDIEAGVQTSSRTGRHVHYEVGLETHRNTGQSTWIGVSTVANSQHGTGCHKPVYLPEETRRGWTEGASFVAAQHFQVSILFHPAVLHSEGALLAKQSNAPDSRPRRRKGRKVTPHESLR